MNKNKFIVGMTLAAILATSGVNNTFAHEKSYSVKSGDTLWKIATQNGISVNDIVSWNNLSTTTIYVGQNLSLLAPHSHDITYIVKSGDYFSVIAKKYGVLIADIKLKNNLSGDSLYIGQKLVIPTEKSVYTTHTVKSGQSLSMIARDYAISLTDLKVWNNLTSDTVKVGQTLYVSKPSDTEEKLEVPLGNVYEGNEVPLDSSQEFDFLENDEVAYLTHKVQAGEYLGLIAKKYNTTIENIKKWNGLKSDVIYVGQVLKVAETSAETGEVKTEESIVYATTHIVRSGEYLSVIASKYNTTVSKIKELNGLTSDIIYVGQVLKVTEGELPAPPAPAYLKDGVFPLAKGTYQPFGDTWGNSRTYGGDRTHEGTDIMAAKGTPIYSATDGVIVNYGWSELGGWRISVKSPEGYNLYYAHMSKYAPGLGKGSTVKKGQLIGYVGDSGYGSEGTTGKFAPHLHFGLYNSSWTAMNAYDVLKYWESK